LPVSHPAPSARNFAEAGIPAGSVIDNGARADAAAPTSQQRGGSECHPKTGPLRHRRCARRHGMGGDTGDNRPEYPPWRLMSRFSSNEALAGTYAGSVRVHVLASALAIRHLHRHFDEAGPIGCHDQRGRRACRLCIGRKGFSASGRKWALRCPAPERRPRGFAHIRPAGKGSFSIRRGREWRTPTARSHLVVPALSAPSWHRRDGMFYEHRTNPKVTRCHRRLRHPAPARGGSAVPDPPTVARRLR
jgi:hypothetical protein